MLSHLKIRAVLLAALFMLVGLFMAAAAAGLMVLHDSRQWVQDLGSGAIDRAGALSDATIGLYQARAALTEAKTFMESGQAEPRDKSLAAAAELMAGSERDIARLRANPDDSGAGRPLYQAALAARDRLVREGLEPMLQALRKWNGIEANRLTETVLPGLSAAFVDSVQEFERYNRRQGDAAVRAVTRDLSASRTAVLILLAVVLLLAAGLAWIFQLAMLRPLAEAGDVFERMAGGDMTVRIVQRSRNEIGALFAGMRRMRAGLAQAVGVVRNGVDRIHQDSREVAAGSADMAERTARQARALEQTAVDMGKLAEMVRLTAGNAQRARQVAAQASDVACMGGTAVAGVTDTMRSIADDSERIGEIVGVIDGIAFQTNILALNAAVEAARAGAHGKGFAVVASEVRSLAQRSGAAAKEVRALIAASRDTVDSGARRVERAGSTMQQVVDAVRQVGGIIDEISRAADVQAQDIARIDEAVSLAGEATRHNAALVQQAAAAAVALQAQAQLLHDAVAVFRIADEPDAATGPGEPEGASIVEAVATPALPAHAPDTAPAAPAHRLPGVAGGPRSALDMEPAPA